MRHKTIILLIAITAFVFRFWGLEKFPSSLNWDEVSHGYNALSLLETGKDQWSQDWPIFNFRAYGDYPTTLNLYLTIPFIKFLGLNELSIRLPSAILGFLSVIFSYLLTKEIFPKNKIVPTITMLLMAISPWSLFPSRAVFQSTVAQFFVIAGFYFLLLSIKNIKHFLLGSLLLSLSVYGYHNTRMVVPLLFSAFILINFKYYLGYLKKLNLSLILGLSIFTILVGANLINLSSPESRARSRWVFIINPATINQIEVSRNEFSGPPLLSKLLFNRYTFFAVSVSKNLLNFFNPLPLFFQGTSNHQFNIPGWGILFSATLPFFYFGLAKFLKDYKKYKFILIWYIVGLIPAIITYGDFQVIRATTILPLPFIAIAYGISFIPKIIPLFAIGLIFQFSSYSYQYFTSYPKTDSLSWQYGYKQAVMFVKDNYTKYDQILITKKYGEPHEFLLFFWPWSASKYQNDQNLVWDYHENWYWVDSFDKFKFINDWEVKSKVSAQPKTLLVTSPGNYPNNYKLINTINLPNGQPVFDITTYE